MKMIGGHRAFHLELTCVVMLTAGACFSTAHAQQPHIGQQYQCTDGRTAIKVMQCSSGNAPVCDLAVYENGVAQPGIRLSLTAVNDLLRLCLGNGAVQQQVPGSLPAAASGKSEGPDSNGFKIGETVNAATAGGWYDAVILRANGNSYFVRFGPSIEVWKNYPTELRRMGPLTDVDRANGLFALHEKVQVNVEGRWVEGEIITEMGMEYQVELSGNRTAWGTAQHMRRVAAAKAPIAPAPGQPPQPGLTSCTGRIEGRYASSEIGNFTIVFRSGKAKVRMYGADDEELECWMSGKRIILHKPGTNEDIPIELNDDGTLDTPMGEIRKKSS